jgi:phage-related holin
MRNYMNKIWNTVDALIGGAAGLALGFVLPIWPFILTAIALVFADAVTGVMAAKKRGEKITSYGFYRTSQKIVVYMVSILACEGVRLVFVPGIPVTYTAAAAISVTELKSILENTRSVSGVNIFQQIGGLLPGKKQQPEEKEE